MNRSEVRLIGLPVLLGAFLAGVSIPARAGPATGVILLRTPGAQHSVEERTRDELRMMNLRVEELDARADEVELEQAIAEIGAVAAIRLDRRGDDYDIVAMFAEDARQSIVNTQQFSSVDSGMVALKVAEIMHYRLTEWQVENSHEQHIEEAQLSVATMFALVPPAPAADAAFTPPDLLARSPGGLPAARATPVLDRELAEIELPTASPPPVRAPPAPRASRGGWIAASVTGGGGPGGAGGLFGVSLTFGHQFVPVLSIQVEMSALASPAPILVRGGTVHVGQGAGQVLLGLKPRGERRVTPRVRMGGGPGLVWALGDARSPLRGLNEAAFVGVVTAGVGVAVRVRPRLHIHAGLDGLVLVPAARVVVDGIEELRFGLPLLRGTVGLEWTVQKM